MRTISSGASAVLVLGCAFSKLPIQIGFELLVRRTGLRRATSPFTAASAKVGSPPGEAIQAPLPDRASTGTTFYSCIASCTLALLRIELPNRESALLPESGLVNHRLAPMSGSSPERPTEEL